MYYLYILYSESANLFYVGYTNDPLRRLIEHNNKPYNSFTSKYRPWKMMALFKCGISQSKAMSMERFIKKQKSRSLIEMLCDPDFIPVGKLSQLIRAPHARD